MEIYLYCIHSIVSHQILIILQQITAQDELNNTRSLITITIINIIIIYMSLFAVVDEYVGIVTVLSCYHIADVDEYVVAIATVLSS
jgi:hypothetical protein